MSKVREEDAALETLLQVAKDIAPELPDDLIRVAYEIQRRHQFDSGEEREVALQEMRKALDDHVAAVGNIGASE